MRGTVLNPMRSTKLRTEIQRLLRCPVCRARLQLADGVCSCTRPECATRFPIVDGVPILLNEAQSIFSIDDFIHRRDTTFQSHGTTLEAIAHGFLRRLPTLSCAVGAEHNYARFGDSLLKLTSAPKVLIVGGSILGEGMEAFVSNPAFELVGTDVALGPLTTVVCDAHDIPFDDNSFDGVVAQAVLEHVVDPYRCVGEIHRVLKAGGLVYVETPFMQQVHMGRYDFTRFTHSGLRRLFRDFDEIASGLIGGPGMALAWSWEYFLLSFTTSRALRAVVRAFASLTAFFLKYLDYYLIDKSPSFDAASGFYFIGQKAGRRLCDRELIRYYRGGLR
jgi:SAM-dependent methyltransferase/uncharacterized protein YbaR (Trm112 family)